MKRLETKQKKLVPIFFFVINLVEDSVYDVQSNQSLDVSNTNPKEPPIDQIKQYA